MLGGKDMEHKHQNRRILQFVMLGVMIVISFSFLFVYGNSKKEDKKVGVSTILVERDIVSSQDEPTEKKEPSVEKNEEMKTPEKNTTSSSETTTETKPETKPSETKKEPAVQEPTKEQEEVSPPVEKKYVTFSIDMKNILGHEDKVNPKYQSYIPRDGMVFAPTSIEIQEGDSVFTLLERVCKQNGIQLIADQGYVRFIHNIGEFDAGSTSGWMYKVNGVMPGVGSNSYQVKEHDVIEWRFTVKPGDI